MQRDLAPVWELIEARIRSDAVYAPSFYILLAIAGLIGAAGILTNSQILIVGAMVVGPEYNATMGVALGLGKRSRRPVPRDSNFFSVVVAVLAGIAGVVSLTEARAAALRVQRVIWRARGQARLRSGP